MSEVGMDVGLSVVESYRNCLKVCSKKHIGTLRVYIYITWWGVLCAKAESLKAA